MNFLLSVNSSSSFSFLACSFCWILLAVWFRSDVQQFIYVVIEVHQRLLQRFGVDQNLLRVDRNDYQSSGRDLPEPQLHVPVRRRANEGQMIVIGKLLNCLCNPGNTYVVATD
jgi:hypothetical protein